MIRMPGQSLQESATEFPLPRLMVGSNRPIPLISLEKLMSLKEPMNLSGLIYKIKIFKVSYLHGRKKILLVEISGVEPLTIQLEEQRFTVVGLAPTICLRQECKTDSSSFA